MGTVILMNDWVMKAEPLTDGSKVFNLENRSIPGTVVRIAGYDEGKTNMLQMMLGEASSYIEVDEVELSKPSLLDTAGDAYVNAAASLCGCAERELGEPREWRATAEFRNTLREIPPLAKPYSVGDIARAYLAKKLAELTINVKT